MHSKTNTNTSTNNTSTNNSTNFVRGVGRSLIALCLPALCSLALPAVTGCAASKSAMPAMIGLSRAVDSAPRPEPVTEDHFVGDRASSVSEAMLARILATPVGVEPGARVGILGVVDGYGADHTVPLDGVTGRLGALLEGTERFSAVTEVAADWERQGSVGGLRELAARYRTEYLVLYRVRFVDRSWTNPWVWTYATGVGVFVAPAHTLETVGVMEATLFDVRTGTILTTVFERVAAAEEHDAFDHERKRRTLKERLVDEAGERLAQQFLVKLDQLDAAATDDNTARAARTDAVDGGRPTEDVRID
jgi:hypothetical protein